MRIPRHFAVALLACPLALALGGCEIPGVTDTAKIAEAREAEGKAIGGACRHSGRALEDCYVMNPKAVKAAVYAGWRDMDAYMRENNIRAVAPDLVDAPSTQKAEGPAAAPPEPAAKAPEEEKKAETKGAKKKAAAKQSAAPDAPTAPLPRRFT